MRLLSGEAMYCWLWIKMQGSLCSFTWESLALNAAGKWSFWSLLLLCIQKALCEESCIRWSKTKEGTWANTEGINFPLMISLPFWSGAPGSQPDEKVLGLPLELWSKAPVRVGWSRDQAHKSRERCLPDLDLQMCLFISNNSTVTKWLCVSFLWWSWGGSGIRSGRNRTEVSPCPLAAALTLEETLNPWRASAPCWWQLAPWWPGFAEHNNFTLALSACSCSGLTTTLPVTGSARGLTFPDTGKPGGELAAEVRDCVSSCIWFGARLWWWFRLVFMALI